MKIQVGEFLSRLITPIFSSAPSSRQTGEIWYESTLNKFRGQKTSGPVDLEGTGGSGSPGGSDTEVQFNNSGTFSGSPNVKIHGDDLMLALEESPTTPITDHIKIFARKVGGRMMVAMKGPSGVDSSLQTHIGRNKIGLCMPAGNTGSYSLLGLTFSATGLATGANVAVTNIHTILRRIDFLVTTAATTAVAGFRNTSAQFAIGHASNPILGGFHLICRWGPATGVAISTHRAFVGMRNTTSAPTDVEPSSVTNIVGMGWDASDTNIQIMHRGTGAVTKIDLGTDFPVPTVDRTDAYEIALFSPPGTTQKVSYEVTNLGTGITTSGEITTNLPATTILLSPQGHISVGGTSSVIGISLSSLYIETDY